ncbi:MAG: ABC transporter substrate-binding protein [Candidatus Onthomonas sp.]
MKKRRMLSLLLALSMVLSLCLTSCGGSNNQASETPADSTEPTAESDAPEAETETPSEELSYEEESWNIYQANLGEYYEYYMAAKDEVESLDQRYALMALAEAKLLESGTVVPTITEGGAYALSRMAPRTRSTVMWGSDYRRYHTSYMTNEILTTEDMTAMRELWNELKGTGTYLESAKSFLAEHGYTLKDTMTLAYTSDPTSWDLFASYLATDSDVLVNTYDGLLQYDCENELQPALAESYEVSEDGLTYTFHIRQGVKWVDSQGRELAEVTADDWVAGMQHLLDAQAGMEYLVDGVLVNASQYISGEITDFSLVGVEAVDDYTLVYTLESPCPYFTTMLGYTVFAPLCRSYYTSQGGTFGEEYAVSGSGNYGSGPNNIAYCGPYLISNWTAQNIIVFTYNESYWNPDNVNVHTITWMYNDGSDPTKSYNDFLAGTTDSVTLVSSTLELAKGDGNFDQYAYVGDTTACSYVLFFGLNRGAFANFNDETVCVSPKADDEEEQARTHAAMNNVHFRRAVGTALDKISWNAQAYGDELAAVSVRNSYTPGTFVTLSEDVTVDINGTSTTFPAGTYYGEIMQAQLDADGVPVKVWDAETESGDGFDGWYNPEYSASELAIAVEELAAEGVVIDEEHPIQIDIVYPSISVTYTNKAMAFKQSVEATTGGLVQINTVAGSSFDDWYYATYYPSYGIEQNCDINDCTGWIPDYGDPSTYLDTMLPEYMGYQTKCFGIY